MRRLSPLQLTQLAEQIVTHGTELPEGLDADQDLALIGLVRYQLHDRLLVYIARQVALDLQRGGPAPGRERRTPC